MGTAEVASAPFFVGAALLVSHDQDLIAIESREPGTNGAVVAVTPVAVQFDELLECEGQIIRRVRAVLVPRDLHGLPGRQIGINVPRPLRPLAAKLPQLLLLLQRAVGRLLQRAAKRLKLQQRLLEIEPWCRR